MALVKSADVDTGVTGSAALHGAVDARGGVQHKGNVLRAQLVFNLLFGNLGRCYGSFAFFCPVGKNHDLR